MDILGISAFYHDSAACLLRDGEIVAAAQEERFSRKKHDPRFPDRAIAYCLEEGKLGMADVDYVVFYDKPFVKFERILMTYLAVAPRGFRAFLEYMPGWLGEKLFMRATLRRRLNYTGEVLFATHHLSHAAAAFFPSPFDDAAVITLDGVGEWATSTYGVGEGNRVRILKQIDFPHSLGLLYSAFTYFTGFKVNSGEYKLMGLAPYGEPRFVDTIKKELIDVKPDGSYRLNMDYFAYCAGRRMTNAKFARLFRGPPRKPETKITQREMDLARSVQDVAEDVILKMARAVHAATGKNRLAIAGGVALNCVANGRLLREGPFDDLWIQPAASDAGNALGCALFVWHQLLGNPRAPHPRRQKASYLGPAFSDDAIRAFLDSEGVAYSSVSEDALAKQTAQLLVDGNVVGWFQGRMEFGPRALGARSILGDPRRPEMQSILNRKIKFRESFRPFAPAVLAEQAAECFELDPPPSASAVALAVRIRQFLSSCCVLTCWCVGMCCAEDTAETLRDYLVARSGALESFAGRYWYTSGHAKPSTYQAYLENRTSGSNEYYWKEKWHSKTGNRHWLEVSRLNGIVSTLSFSELPSGELLRAPSGIVGHRRPPYPEGAFLGPGFLVGDIHGVPLEALLSGGDLTLQEVNGHEILTWVSGGTRVDYHIDQDFRLVRIEIGEIPDKPSLEAAVEAKGIEPSDLFRVRGVYRLTQYHGFGALELPTKVTHTIIKYHGNELEALQDDVKNGELDVVDLVMRWYRDYDEQDVFTVNTMMLDVGSVQINPPLSDDDFKIAFPDGTLVVDELADTWYIAGTTTGEHMRNPSHEIRRLLAENLEENTVSEIQPSTQRLDAHTAESPTAKANLIQPDDLTRLRPRTKWYYVLVCGGLAMLVAAFVFGLHKRTKPP